VIYVVRFELFGELCVGGEKSVGQYLRSIECCVNNTNDAFVDCVELKCVVLK
jgi:hypothetical protein